MAPLSPSGPAPALIVADDDPIVHDVLRHHFDKAGWSAAFVSDGAQLLAAVGEETLVAVVDVKMPPPRGLDCLREMKTRFPGMEVIMLTAVNQAAEALASLRGGAFDYITKPFDPEELVLAVRKARAVARTAQENVDLRRTLESPGGRDLYIGESAAMQRIASLIDRLASSPNTVLLTGESGVGKGVIARALHQRSPRAAAPFIAVSCPSLPNQLLESEMFGHEKGAFTGADQRRRGRVELADGGTLFLDEIGEMPLELQPKLLTFLQERTFYRLGGQAPREADVRVIAATNRDLEAMVREGTFREDLYFRLNVLPLELPPLRVRREDILPLAHRFLFRAAERAGAGERVPTLSAEAERVLRHYDWPGNVRELENAIERAYTLRAREDAVNADDFPPRVWQSEHPSAVSSRPLSILAGRPLREIEQEAIAATLELTDGNKREAAKLLGIAEKSIYNKMRRSAEAA